MFGRCRALFDHAWMAATCCFHDASLLPPPFLVYYQFSVSGDAPFDINSERASRFIFHSMSLKSPLQRQVPLHHLPDSALYSFRYPSLWNSALFISGFYYRPDNTKPVFYIDSTMSFSASVDPVPFSKN